MKLIAAATNNWHLMPNTALPKPLRTFWKQAAKLPAMHRHSRN